MVRRHGMALLFIFATVPALAGDWPAWRGPHGDGHTAERNLPLKWTSTENVKWKVALPDEGNSTPIIWGDRIFLTQALERVDWPPKPAAGGPASAQRRAVLCLQRSDGKLLWQRDTLYKEKESTHPTNPFCSASPVTDGERVIASLGSAGMVCYDFAGNELWRKELGKLEHIWGNGSSPVLYGNLAILWCGPGQRQFLLAVNKVSGKTVWEKEVPGGKGDSGRPYIGSWSTPILVRVGDQDQLVVPAPERLKAFDPRTGAELWSCDGLHNPNADELVYTSPVYRDGIVVAMAGFGGADMAVRADGKGDVSKTHRLWRIIRAIRSASARR
jgi:outer membrane protein assembly factor BamB